ncbi:hypothetical protein [Kribbella sp. CCNWLY201]|uniref:hypothetical protein n=1 Tax=Kribbella sp. CCNWLY201 TaxID=3128544 RepID=UPI0030186DF5
MATVTRGHAGIPAVIALAVVLGLLTLFTHSSPHSSSSRSDSVGSYLHGCTSTLESVRVVIHGSHVENRATASNPVVTPATGPMSGSAADNEPHPMPGACLAVLIAIAVGVLLGFALRALPSRRWILPPPSTIPVLRPRTAWCLPARRLALCSRLLL